MKPEVPAVCIGWREYVDLPDWGLFQIKAKADTGARSSSIDVSHIEELGEDRVRFEVVGDRREGGSRQVVEAAIVRRSRVRSSFGQAQDRIFVEATIRLAGQSVRAEVGLMSRENMICRMLLGRRSLAGLFLVDSGHCYLHGRKKRKLSQSAVNRTSPSQKKRSPT